jgi:hypothetical protein
MKLKQFLLLLLFILLQTTVFAQKGITQFYLKPYIGGEWLVSNYENRSEKPDIARAIPYDLTDKYGINLLVDFNNHFSLEFGYGGGNIGWGESNNHITGLGRGVRGASARQERWNLTFVRPIKLVNIKRKHKKDLEGVFDIGLVAGISYEHIPLFHDGSNIGSNLIKEIEINMIKQNAWGGEIGFNLQFYQQEKRRVELGFVYHHGFSKRIVITWEDTTQADYTTFNTFTRGSMFAIYLSYPIALFKIRKK